MKLKDIKTTIIGGIFFLMGVTISMVEYFSIGLRDWQDYLFPIGLMVCGIGFLLAPDRILDVIFGWIKKK